MDRPELTDAQWDRLRLLLPPQKPPTGRPAHDHRTVINGILWVLRTGSPWRCLPGRFGSWKTVSSRFYRWQRAGVWDRVLAALQRRADAEGRLDWTLHFAGRTAVRAHQPAGTYGGNAVGEVMATDRGRSGRSDHSAPVPYGRRARLVAPVHEDGVAIPSGVPAGTGVALDSS